MKTIFNKGSVNLCRPHLWLLFSAFLISSISLKAQGYLDYEISKTKPVKVTFTIRGLSNACATKYGQAVYMDGVLKIPEAVNDNVFVEDFSAKELKDYTISYHINYYGLLCNYNQHRTLTIKADELCVPISNLQASQHSHSNEIVLTWDINEVFKSHEYIVRNKNTKEVIAKLPSGTTSFSHQGLVAGTVHSYEVIAVVNDKAVKTATVTGSTHDLQLQASSNLKGKIEFTWNNTDLDSDINAFLLQYLDSSGTYTEAENFKKYSGSDHSIFKHAEEDIIPGYTYKYKCNTLPLNTYAIVDSAYGRMKPDGKIEGSVTTPVNISNMEGVGIANVGVVASLIGDALPSDSTRVYSAFTDKDGNYSIENIYYYTEADFKVHATSNYSLCFTNSADNYAEINDTVIPASGDFTVEVWAKAVGENSSYREILSQNTGADGSNFYIGKSNDGFIRAGDGWLNTGVPFPSDGGWHHYAVVKTADSAYLYLDGIKKATVVAFANPTGSQFRIGRQYGAHGEYFKGNIDEVRVWNTARSAEEITAFKDSEVPDTVTGLQAYYKMSNGYGETISDWSENKKQLTLLNTNSWNALGFPFVPEADTAFAPDSAVVTLSMNSRTTTADFVNNASFLISGTIVQQTANGNWPMADVSLFVDGTDQNVTTDSLGNFTVPVSSGGTYTIEPKLHTHLFSPAKMEVTVTQDVDSLLFSDTTTCVIDGYVRASCQSYAGTAQLRFFDAISDSSFSDTVFTETGTGYYSVTLPARNCNVEVLQFESFDTSIVKSADVAAYFNMIKNIDLTYYDSSYYYNDTLAATYDSTANYRDTASIGFVYRQAPKLKVEGIHYDTACNGTVLLKQYGVYDLQLFSTESFNGKTCLAGEGYIKLRQNISVDGMEMQTDSFAFSYGDTVHFELIPGTPNIIAPYYKTLEAISYLGDQRDTVRYDVIVTGHRPREKTFTTVSPEMPFHILHKPPGDNSYSYIEANSSISTSFTQSFLQEGAVDGYVRAQLGKEVSVEVSVGAGASIDLYKQFDITASAGAGASRLENWMTGMTLTTTERFETSGNDDIMGNDGDVYIGGAMNMIYAVSDVVSYNEETCAIDTSKTLMMEPNGFETTFMYTEDHIKNVIIPEQKSFIRYYTEIGSDSAVIFTEQLKLWNQVIEQNHANIDSAVFIENKTVSGGIINESSIETTREKSNSYEVNWFVDYSVAVELGMSVAGMGVFGGVQVSGRSEWNHFTTNDSSNTVTTGYVLADDDIGDSYSIDILEDRVYGVPAFRLVSARTSCPWVEGTLPREGVQLISDKISQSVEETEQAVYVLQLSNLSQSDEEMTYDLKFVDQSNSGGASITISGSPAVGGSAYSYTIPAQSSVNVTVTVSKGPTASDYAGLKFILQSQCDENISSEVTLDAHFYKEYELTVVTEGEGTTNIPAGDYIYREGEIVNLYASPSEGYVFEKWTVGSDEYTKQAIQLTVNTDVTAKAYFVKTEEPQSELTISSTENGQVSPPEGSYYFVTGANIKLTAVAEINSVFQKWIINGEEVYEPETNVTLTSETSAKAFFIQNHTVSIDTTGKGSAYTLSGSTEFTDSSKINLFAVPDSGYVFEKWIINTVEYNEQLIEFLITENINATAVFSKTDKTQYAVTISTQGQGTTNLDTDTYYFAEDENTTITAIAEEGYQFDKWVINGIESLQNPISITINGNISATAYFSEIPAIQYTVEVAQPENGTINIATGEHQYEEGDIIKLTAKADSAFVFEKWIVNDLEYTTDSIEITISADTKISAYFSEIPAIQYTVEVAQPENGTINIATGEHQYEEGDIIKLIAKADSAFVFEKWIINDLEYTTDSIEITISADTKIGAHFSEIPAIQYTVEVAQSENGTINIATGEHQYEEGDIIKLTAKAVSAFVFEKWIINDLEYTNDSIEITISADTKIEAIFTKETVGINKSSNTLEAIVFPNASKGTIQITSETAIKEVAIFNILGKEVLKMECALCNNHLIDINHLPDGTYIILLKSDGSTASQQLELKK